MFRFAAVLFDLDGTLIDSAPDLAAAAERMRLRRGLPPMSLERYRPWAGAGARGMLRVGFELSPEDEGFLALREEFFEEYQQGLLDQTSPFDGVPDLIAQLVSAGIPWGVVTNKAERFTHPLLAGLPLFATAGAVVCGDTTPHPKPHPEPLYEAARRVGASPERCVYVGDDERDVVAGNAAGMTTLVANYGYLGAHKHPHEWGGDAIADSPEQVLKWLQLP
ncbi:HAD-IA family hydrolase [Hydrogenophaga sp. 5NK40-0174]|uniref:HAD-IA family hydrolase n=1 Tax=Hydrogenophaga sp. 5NK40-0174 TaxID=3127649 RepID=UPI00310A9BA6